MNEGSNPTAQERAAQGAERVALATAMGDLVAAVKGGDTHTIEQAGEHLRVAELASWRVQRDAEIADNVAAAMTAEERAAEGAERNRVAAEAMDEWDEYLDSDDYKEQQYNEAMERAEAEHYLEQARARLEEFAAARWPTTQAGTMEAVRALLDLERVMKDAGYHPAGRTRTGAGDPVTALQDVLHEAHPQQMSLAVDALAVVLDGIVDKLYNRNPVDNPNVQKAVRAELLAETKRMAMLPSSRVEAAEFVTELVDYVNTASYVPLTPEQQMQAEAAAHEAAAILAAEQETAHQAGVELGVQAAWPASRAPEAGMSESTIASRVEELWTANQREAAESRRKIMSAHELGGYGLPQSGGRSNPPARGLVNGTVEGVGQGVPRAATLGDTTMIEDARKPSRQTRVTTEDQKTRAELHSHDAAVRVAAASGALSAGMLEEALSSRRKDVRQAALTHQPLTPSTVSHFIQNGSVSDRLIIATRPGLTAGATSELLRDTSARVRLATIEHQEINPEWLDLTLQVTRGRELLAVIQHNALSAGQVEGLLEDRDGRVRLATVQYQALSTDQAGRLLDEYATSTNAIEMEIRRAAVDRAEPRRLQVATADRDPVVAERARQELDAVAADMVAKVEAASALSSDDAEAWAQAGQREIDHEAAREAQATAREADWWFDQAWAERADLLSSVGSRPEDPQASLASLTRDRDATAERLARLQRSAGMLPLGSRGILDQAVADANAQAARAAAQVAAVEATILNGSHPQVLACAKFDLENGVAAERIAELNRQCIQGLSALSKDDWTVAPLPTSEVAQAVWLARFGEYAAAAAHVERTGTVAEADVAARIAHHARAVDTAFRVSRGGYSDETELSYGF